MRLAPRVPQRKIRPVESWHACMFNDVLCASHDDSGYAVCFKITGDQTDRLMANGSRGHQQSNVCLQLPYMGQGIWCILFCCDALAAIGWYANELVSQFANHTGSDSLL